jgi:outer membrane biogenesis lipoprotein LolB
MRLVVTTIVSALLLSACASEGSAPAQTAQAEPQKTAPRCYSGDDGKFYPVGQKAVISGVDVTCSATADGKSGQWMGAKHK